ncbi:hypothetical protein [Rhizobium sp. RCAM05973]|uniref:hypothetical protein n=1 Tax=Rhizobium sp. RCAM05973 TaxID=2994066 RepID=UPI0022EBAED2|nr:hypothetical protein [Rhizobium sp. RCAM05973]
MNVERLTEALRSLIDETVLALAEKRGEVHAALCGELFGILDNIPTPILIGFAQDSFSFPAPPPDHHPPAERKGRRPARE